MRGLVAVVAAAACGQVVPASAPVGPRLDASDVLVVVAHQDDDLLFMQPDLYEDVRAGRSITIVDVTAGDAGNGIAYVDARQQAQRAAYGLLVGDNTWDCEPITLTGHAAERCQLAAAPISLVFLGYPDGGISGQLPQSLLKLWDGEIGSATTVASTPATYDQAGLIATLTDVVSATSPSVIRTLDISGTHGTDHIDHMIVGALTVLATAQAASDARLIAYRGYNTASEPPNTAEIVVDDASYAYRAYQACMTGCGACGTEACPTISDVRFNNFIHRRYATSRRASPLTGMLRIDDRCLVADPAGTVALGDCGDGALRLGDGETLQVGNQCLQGDAAGDVFATDCTATPSQRWIVDDEGHVWLGVPPASGPGMDYDHSLCLAADDGGVHVAVCGSQRDARWELVRPAVATPDAAIGLRRSGRARRLADMTGDGLADLCSVELGDLRCAPGDGTGGFGPATQIVTGLAPLAIEPESLALGDVDGDGLADACGRTGAGITCAMSAAGFAPALFTPAFASAGPVSVADRSLAIVDGQVCGHTSSGAICAKADTTTLSSPWPQTGSLVWPAALDTDGIPDWCMATTGGPQCGVSSLAPITEDGVPWGFSENAQVEGATSIDGPTACERSALEDIDGDGRADLCVALGNQVECARAQDNGFGPRAPALAIAGKITSLWLGDLDGDGRADVCVDDGTNVTCELSP